ncbi:efflux RND transporter periplasmic adaptor subunit [Myroides pelagicus]|uniref:efflux RND transporter periplasmic adaptor subunit n=1 Tax=Myroides pelagicus TaxID=270914 RepID=UPI002DBC6FB7|nr:efflux RND transporter periplasmic adaptor subunit [Myroides pelagicus]MEC4114906.1 efflux RND transporter periplasmic adaptor subunit [Myroides pelagicus]
MKKTYSIILGLLLLVSCSDQKSTQQIVVSPEVDLPVKLERITLQKSRPVLELQLPGELISDQRTELLAKVNSYVSVLKVDIGDRVKRGQVLLVLHAPEIEAELHSAKAKWKAQESNAVLSKAIYNRIVRASKTPGAIATDLLEQATAKMQSDKASEQALYASYQQLSQIIEYLTIRSPFSGVVTERNVDQGTYVSPMSKTPLLVVEDIDNLRLETSVSQVNTSFVNRGDTLYFTTSSTGSKRYEAVVSRKAQRLDTKLRAELIQADVANKDKKLKPNMVADVFVSLQGKEATFFVPKSAVVDSNLGVYVISVDKGKVKHISVRTGRVIKDKIEVFGDLVEGQQILKAANEEIENQSIIDK